MHGYAVEGYYHPENANYPDGLDPMRVEAGSGEEILGSYSGVMFLSREDAQNAADELGSSAEGCGLGRVRYAVVASEQDTDREIMQEMERRHLVARSAL